MSKRIYSIICFSLIVVLRTGTANYLKLQNETFPVKEGNVYDESVGNVRRLWLVDPLMQVYPDQNSTVTKDYSNFWTYEGPCGTKADVIILVSAPVGSTISIKVKREGTPFEEAQVYKLITVPVEQNTGIDKRTERFSGIENPFVIRRAPFNIYEVIEPLEDKGFKSKDRFSAFYIQIPTVCASTETNDEYQVKVNVGDELLEGVFYVNTYAVKLPSISNSSFFYSNWLSVKSIEKYHKVRRFSDEWYSVISRYSKLMAHGRQNSILIPQEFLISKGNDIVLLREELIKFVDLFKDAGFKYFEGPHLTRKSKRGERGLKTLEVYLTKRSVDSDSGRHDLGQIIKLYKQFIAENDLEQNWFVHIADEPTNEYASAYMKVAKMVQKELPISRIIDATNVHEKIEGAIDIWGPTVKDFQDNKEFFFEMKQNGNAYFVYTCLHPGGRWLNRLLDQEKVRQVYFGWAAIKYDSFGFLHWGLNKYQKDPFQYSVVKFPNTAKQTNQFIPAGDSHIIFPGDGQPLSSLRFEAHRVGIEDYEMLSILEAHQYALTDSLINSVFKNYKDYNTDLKKYRLARKKLLESLKDN